MAISTAWEAVLNSGEKELQPCDINHIEVIEDSLFTDYLGLDFKTVLEADLLDYSAVTAWVKGTYLQDVMKSYKGFIYKVNVATTDKEPNISTDWVKVDEKFETPCYNELWCKGGLKELFAYRIIRSNIPTIKSKLVPAGHVNATGKSFTQASSKATDRRIDQQEQFIQQYVSIVDRWMRANNNTKCFDKYTGIVTDIENSSALNCNSKTTTKLHDDGIWVT